ncbi:MAG: FkbM family methyltransferase [Sedimentisphaerales bacterium]|nr:FkbM family methyltransferase [Sedimentisphaerales bacterium]
MKQIFNYFVKKRGLKNKNPFQVQRCLFGDVSDLIIFDIGAYIGTIASIYKKTFPDSTIYCFEPFPESFEKLSQLCNDKSIYAYQMAIADKCDKTALYVNTDLSCNSFFPRPESGYKYYPKDSSNIREIQVETTILDSFCDENRISKIDILKLDVEGAEIKVLKGASKKLTSKKIKLIYTEVMFIPHYKGGCLFHDVANFLSQYDYSLFNLYNLKQAHNGQLRWGNAIFVSPEMRIRIEST